jgi:hypothetical protein
MATLIDLPGTATVALSTLAVGQWCTIPTLPGQAFRVMEKRASDALLAQFGPSADCDSLVRNLTTQVVQIPNPVTVTVGW